MKSACWFLVVAACSGTSTPVAPTVALANNCPTCPACPVTLCATRACPTCPPPPHILTPDWHCTDFHRPNKEPLSFCMSKPNVCEQKRKDIATRKLGTSTPCTTMRVTFCFDIANSFSLSSQIMCMRTAKECEERRQYFIDKPYRKDDEISECVRALNIDRHDAIRAPEP